MLLPTVSYAVIGTAREGLNVGLGYLGPTIHWDLIWFVGEPGSEVWQVTVMQLW